MKRGFIVFFGCQGKDLYTLFAWWFSHSEIINFFYVVLVCVISMKMLQIYNTRKSKSDFNSIVSVFFHVISFLLLFSGWGANISYRLRERPFFEKQTSRIKGSSLMLR
jgi:hypothetical protein